METPSTVLLFVFSRWRAPLLSVSVFSVLVDSPVRVPWLQSLAVELSWLAGKGLLLPSPSEVSPLLQATVSLSALCPSVCILGPKSWSKLFCFADGKRWWFWLLAAALPLLTLLFAAVFFDLFWALFAASVSPDFFFPLPKRFAHNSLKSLSCSSIGLQVPVTLLPNDTVWTEGQQKTAESAQVCILHDLFHPLRELRHPEFTEVKAVGISSSFPQFFLPHLICSHILSSQTPLAFTYTALTICLFRCL